MATDIFAAVDAAIIAALRAENIAAYDYESPALSRLPCATVVPAGFGDDYLNTDQGDGFGAIMYNVRYYVSLSKDAKLAWADLKTGINKVRAALGVSDPTLSGAVRDCRISGGRVSALTTPDGKPRELMAEFELLIRPRPHIG
jgi:hypothetical protein